MQITVKTPQNEVKIDIFHNFIETKAIKIDKPLFVKLCKEGCRNYNQKYSCPPFSPKFDVKEPYLFVVMISINLEQFKYKDYHKLRVGNAMIKPRIEKIMRKLEEYTKTKFLSTGACRLCKPCKLKLKKPCQHPEKMRYSLEALGVDCQDLTQKAFKKDLLWYNKKAPEYTSVIAAIPLKTKDNNIIEVLKKCLQM